MEKEEVRSYHRFSLNWGQINTIISNMEDPVRKMVESLNSLSDLWVSHTDHVNCKRLAISLHLLFQRALEAQLTIPQAIAVLRCLSDLSSPNKNRCPHCVSLPFGSICALSCTLLKVLQWGFRSRELSAPAVDTALVLLRMLRVGHDEELADALEEQLLACACSVANLQRSAAERGWPSLGTCEEGAFFLPCLPALATCLSRGGGEESEREAAEGLLFTCESQPGAPVYCRLTLLPPPDPLSSSDPGSLPLHYAGSQDFFTALTEALLRGSHGISSSSSDGLERRKTLLSSASSKMIRDTSVVMTRTIDMRFSQVPRTLLECAKQAVLLVCACNSSTVVVQGGGGGSSSSGYGGEVLEGLWSGASGWLKVLCALLHGGPGRGGWCGSLSPLQLPAFRLAQLLLEKCAAWEGLPSSRRTASATAAGSGGGGEGDGWRAGVDSASSLLLTLLTLERDSPPGFCSIPTCLMFQCARLCLTCGLPSSKSLSLVLFSQALQSPVGESALQVFPSYLPCLLQLLGDCVLSERAYSLLRKSLRMYPHSPTIFGLALLARPFSPPGGGEELQKEVAPPHPHSTTSQSDPRDLVSLNSSDSRVFYLFRVIIAQFLDRGGGGLPPPPPPPSPPPPPLPLIHPVCLA